MAADVSTGNNKQENETKKGELFTRDLLGGSGICVSGGELEATVEWEKKFDLLLGQQRSSGSGKASRAINLNLPPPPPPSISSVCTLEKVKSALERANGKSNSSVSSSSSSSSSSSIKRSVAAEGIKTDGQDAKAVGGPMMISRCPKCMQYLLVFKVDPRCPRCDTHVPEPNYMKNNDRNSNNKKKAKIDLNVSITD